MKFKARKISQTTVTYDIEEENRNIGWLSNVESGSCLFTPPTVYITNPTYKLDKLKLAHAVHDAFPKSKGLFFLVTEMVDLGELLRQESTSQTLKEKKA
jgi:hypothetical protein